MSRPFYSRSFPSREPKYRRNGKIRAREVRVLDAEKNQLGVMSLSDALRLAQNRGMDLVEINATAIPPVCRIVDYGKLMYEEAKSHKESRPVGSQSKEIQLSAGIGDHDFGVKLQQAIEFLSDDMQVRIKLRFKGRQKAHKELGFELVNRYIKELAAYGLPVAPPKMLGDRDLNAVINPLPRNKRGKVAREASHAGPVAAPAPREKSAVPATRPQEASPVDSAPTLNPVLPQG